MTKRIIPTFVSSLQRSKSQNERFWEKVDKSTETGCWEWLGSVNNYGYGKLWFHGKLMLAHRISWMLANGDIPSGGHYGTVCVLHRCDNPPCVNPDHMFLGSQSENVMDMMQKNRSNNCKLSVDNVIDIRRLYAAGNTTMSNISDIYGISEGAVSMVVNRKRWDHVK